MLGTIIRNQILENVYGIKFIIIFVVCTVLMVGTAISGVGRYSDHQEDEVHIDTTNRKTLAEADSWRDVGREGRKIVKPANRLSVLSSGLEESVGRTATVKIDDFPYLEDSIYSTAPIFAIFGDLDMTFIIRTVVSLFVILFTFDLISGEKERGTLKQCLANPVPRNTFMLGKSIGSFISLLIPIVIPLLISLLVVMVIGGVNFSSPEWISLGVILLGYLLYVLCFFSIGVFVSTLVRSSAVSFLVLLFVWVVVVLIIPKGSMMMAGQIHPIDSINDVRANLFSLRENYTTELRTKAFEEINARGVMELPERERWSQFRAIWTEMRDEMEPAYEEQKKKINEEFKRNQGNLTELAVNLSRISPASAVTYISMNMSGTGYNEQENFIRQLTLYRDQFTDHVEKEEEREREERAGHSFTTTSQEEQGQLEINSIPRFEYSSYTPSERLSMVLPDIAMLAIISIIFYLLAFINFIRYDVR